MLEGFAEPWRQEIKIKRSRRISLFDILPQIPIDGAYAYLLFVTMLFVQELGSLAGVIISALPIAYGLLRRGSFLGFVGSRWLLFAFPAFALCSVLWSEDAPATVRYALELIVTVVAAIALAAARRPNAVIKAVALAFLTYAGGSLVFGHYVGVGLGGGGTAFSGLGDGKNMMGDIAAVGLLAMCGAFFVSVRNSVAWSLLSAAGAALEVYVVLQARSAGAMIGVGGALAVMAAVVAGCAMSRTLRIVLLFFVGVCAAVVASLGNLQDTLLSFGLSLFDKDPTLTGRTYLWYRANDLIADKPLLGTGFFAFWRQGNPDAEGLWRYAGITSRSGFNFHSTITELLVEVGYVGAAIFVAVGLVSVLGLMGRYVNRPTAALTFWLGLVAYALIRAPFEAFGYGPFYYTTALLFGAAAIGLSRVRAPAVKITRAQARAAEVARLRQLGALRQARWQAYRPQVSPAE